MSLLHWRTKPREGESTDPSPWAGLRHEIDKLVDSFVREPLGSHGKWAPAIEIVESDEAVVVRVELPGVDPNDIDVTVAGGRLVLSGEKPEPARNGVSEVCRCEVCRCEVRYGAFRRSVPLPEEVDIEKIDAGYRNGVLTVRVPKHPPGGVQKVHIKVASEVREHPPE